MNIITRSFARVANSSLRSTATTLVTVRRTNMSLLHRYQWAVAANKSCTNGSNDVEPKTCQAAEPDWPRPIEVPYQPKVANSVNLIGYVSQPVQFEASLDGKFWAGTVISQGSRSGSASSPLWIPIIFQGDLAHTAACHLRENDQVLISGKLFIDSPPNLTDGQASVQVMVQSLNFIEKFPSFNKESMSHRSEEGIVKHSVGVRKNGDVDKLESWRHLLDNPKDWWDYRESKKKGLSKTRHPDFKRRGDGLALWLDSAPDWVSLKLEGEVFDAPVLTKNKQRKGDDTWKELAENPDKWWDNRLDKRNEKAPDFRHKETGEGLWLTDSPTWVLPKLPPLKHKEGTKMGK